MVKTFKYVENREEAKTSDTAYIFVYIYIYIEATYVYEYSKKIVGTDFVGCAINFVGHLQATTGESSFSLCHLLFPDMGGLNHQPQKTLCHLLLLDHARGLEEVPRFEMRGKQKAS